MAQADTVSVINSLKAVTQALSQFKAAQSTDGRRLQLAVERIEALVELTSTRSTSSSANLALLQLSRSSLPALDCLSVLVTVLTDPTSPKKLLAPCLQLLCNFSLSRELRAVLQDTLQIAGILSNLLEQFIDDSSFHLLCLKAVQALTYNAVFTAADGYVEQIVRVIIPHILSPSSDKTVPALAILANVTRKSMSVQAYVKSLPNCRALLRTLISCLSHSNVSIIVCSLAPLANICLHEELGTKLFNSKNVDQSFQLIFGLLTDDTGPMVIRYAVDLFCDLLTSPSIAQALIAYANLRESLVRIVDRLEFGPVEVTCKLLELLCSLCSMPGLDAVHLGLVRLILSPAGGRDASATHPFLAVLKCAAHAHHYTAMQASQLLSHILGTSHQEGTMCSVQPHLTPLLQVLSSALTQLIGMQLWNNSDAEGLLAHMCLQAAAALELLVTVVNEDQFSAELGKHITPEICGHLLEQQLSNNPGIYAAASASVTGDIAASSAADSDSQSEHWSVTGVHVTLLTLQLMTCLGKHSTQIEVQLQRVLQDARLLPFLASTLKSKKKLHVQRGLSMLLAACRQADQDDMSRLADVLANMNCTRQQHGGNVGRHSQHPSITSSQALSSAGNMQSTLSSATDHHCVAQAGRTASVDADVLSPPSSQCQAGDVQALIERMQSGLDLKDIRAHEIMEIYEHELATRSTKETHLQDLLEAKTMALSQADRLIAQYRCRRAQSESECSKLRTLLQECEKRSSHQQLELQGLVTTQQSLEAEISQLQQSRRQLERLTDEHTLLRGAYDEQKHKLDGTLRSLSAAQEEQSSLSDLLDMQRKHCDKLKAQFESSNSQLEALERQHQQLIQQFTDKDIQCNELQHNLQQTEKLRAGRDQECGQLQKELQATRADLGRAEEAKHRLARQVASLEEESAQVKRRLQGADAELEKHRKLRAMIHNLSGGNQGSQASSQAM